MQFNALIPELSVTDIEKSVFFYVNVLRFKIEYERKEDKFAFLSYGAAQLMLEQINDHWNVGDLVHPFGRGVNFQIETNDIDAIRQSLIKHGFTPFKDVFESAYASNDTVFRQKEMLVCDPDGYLLRFSQDL